MTSGSTSVHSPPFVEDLVGSQKSSQSSGLHDSHPLLLKEADIHEHYVAVGVPYVPLLGIFLNFFLVSQLSVHGLMALLFYFIFVSIMYLIYGVRYSVISPDISYSSLNGLDQSGS